MNVIGTVVEPFFWRGTLGELCGTRATTCDRPLRGESAQRAVSGNGFPDHLLPRELRLVFNMLAGFQQNGRRMRGIRSFGVDRGGLDSMLYDDRGSWGHRSRLYDKKRAR